MVIDVCAAIGLQCVRSSDIMNDGKWYELWVDITLYYSFIMINDGQSVKGGFMVSWSLYQTPCDRTVIDCNLAWHTLRSCLWTEKFETT